MTTSTAVARAPKVVKDVFAQVVKTLGKGADKDQKDIAKLQLENAFLRIDVKESERQQADLAQRANNYAAQVSQQMDATVADIGGTTIAVTAGGVGVGFIAELLLPNLMPNYPTVAKALPYVAGGVGLLFSYVLTEPSDLERQQGGRPDLSSRYNGMGFSAGLLAGAGVAQVGQTVTDAILKAVPTQGS